MFMILCVIDDPQKLDDVLEAWQTVGINGATILESTGLNRRKNPTRVPMRYVFGGTSEPEYGNFTLMSVVETEDQVQGCLEATETVIGSLNKANSGIFTAWPLLVAKGISSKGAAGEVKNGMD